MYSKGIHSAQVNMFLQVNGSRIDVAGCLGNVCTLREPIDLEPCTAEFVIVVDGQERRREVYLESGISSKSLKVSFH